MGENKLSMPHESDEQMRNISEFSESETVPVHQIDATQMGSPRSASALPPRHHKSTSSIKEFDSKGHNMAIYDTTNKGGQGRNEVNYLNISERPNCKLAIYLSSLILSDLI